MFEYTVIKSKRKSLSFIIERDKSVIVRAPHTLSDERIADEVSKRKILIQSKIDSDQKLSPKSTPKEFVDGEQFLFIGNSYSLQVIVSEQRKVEFNSSFVVYAQNRTVVKNLLFEWYQQQAMEILIPRIKHFAEHLGVKRKRINITAAKYTWGSCTAAGTLNFNWRIIKAPIDVIDYIVVHELAHLREHNHSPEFWNIVAVQIPHFEEAKQWLKFNGNVLDEDF